MRSNSPTNDAYGIPAYRISHEQHDSQTCGDDVDIDWTLVLHENVYKKFVRVSRQCREHMKSNCTHDVNTYMKHYETQHGMNT